MSGGRVVWLAETDPPEAFPPVADALREPDGLLAAGGDLGTARLLSAYRQGIFPWYDEGQPLLWWSPDPRCVLRPGELHVSRRLRRDIRRWPWELRCNTRFDAVIEACAAPRRHQRGTWITPEMQAAYRRLHAEGWAHSLEIWLADELAFLKDWLALEKKARELLLSKGVGPSAAPSSASRCSARARMPPS